MRLRNKGERINMEKIRVGVIGCGGIANGKHLPALKNVKEVEMVAFCDIIEERAVEAAKKYGTPDAKVYTDYKELLKDESIVTVHVCTPNRSHSFISIDAMEAGKHVMCEKPMAKTYAEAKAMYETSVRTGKLLTIGVFLNEYEQGGGPLIDIGTHALDLTLWMMDNYKPKMVVGTKYKKLGDQKNTANAWGDWDPEKYTVEDSAFGFVVMENGATVSVESSWALNIADPEEASTLLVGDKGGADMHDGLRLNYVKNGRQVIEKPDFSTGGVAFFEGTSDDPKDLECHAFYDSVINGTPLRTKPEQAMVVTQILEAIYESAATGKPVYFD